MLRNWVIYAAAVALTATSLTVSAGKDPFKKNKDYKFLDDTRWYKKSSTVIKAGSAKESGDTFYYHLSVNSKQLRLHLGKNDPSGELKDTRQLDYMSIVDVAVDGRTLDRFKWCLNNQDGPSVSLKQNARVAGSTCINAGDDFIIRMDDKTLKQLMSAKTISFVIEPFGDTVNLTYSMNGFASLMREVNKPVVAKKPVIPKAVAKKERTCYAQPPAEFKSSVNRIAYPCDNAGKKSAATRSMNARSRTLTRRSRRSRSSPRVARPRSGAPRTTSM